MSEVDSMGKAMAEVDRAVQERMCAHERLILAVSPLNKSWYTCCHSLALAQGKMVDAPRVPAIFLVRSDFRPNESQNGNRDWVRGYIGK